MLADALSYVQANYKPENVINIATLTGACGVALVNINFGFNLKGRQNWGIVYKLRNFGNRHYNSFQVSAAFIYFSEVSEPFWHLPINTEHRDDMKSSFADLRNAGKDRYGGASKGAAFLEKFIEPQTNWVHLDIAA